MCLTLQTLTAINSIVSDGKLAGAIEISIYVYKPSNGSNEATSLLSSSAMIFELAQARDVRF